MGKEKNIIKMEQVKAKSKYGLSISKKEEKKPFKIIKEILLDHLDN